MLKDKTENPIFQQVGDNYVRKSRRERRYIKSLDRKFQKKHGKKSEWNEVNKMYKACLARFSILDSLYEKLLKFNELVKNEGVLFTNLEKDVLSKLVDIITNDHEYLLEELEKIHNLHSSKKGPMSVTELGFTLELAGQYDGFDQIFSSVIPITFDHIIDIMHMYLDRHIEHKQADNQPVEEVVVQLKETITVNKGKENGKQ